MDMVVLIDTPEFKLLNNSRLVKNSSIGAIVESAELIKLAEQSRATVAEQCEMALELAKKNGYKEGMAQANVEMSAQLARVVASRQVSLHDLGPLMADIVTDTVKSMLKQIDTSLVYKSAFDAVNRHIQKAQWIELRVHPSHVDAVQKTVDELATNGAPAFNLPFISITADHSLEPYDCLFQTDIGSAEAGLDVQLESIRAAVLAGASAFNTTRSDETHTINNIELPDPLGKYTTLDSNPQSTLI
jgi:type III secretion protein L